ncbi:hypothetical protein D0Z08_08695 [Nocardioides immobilis]|uniref:Lipoprotein n=1 Tax=Nocardioides immobilis TaxID=2049295 RepID=A0A417Y581_9ACTN|nr:DUF6174 domain-containing protein [Nocardioides immobilis]RHW27726.1 hypothetical protein D0Z08_08695 [Nocardioides immobilis]
MKILLSAAATAVALAALAGCSGDDTTTAEDPESTTPATSDPTDSPTVGSYPELEATDYTYVLEQICYCPIAGPVKVTVEDGEVTSAVYAKGGRGLEKGDDAPDYLWITINDVIAKANDTKADKVDVTWPEGQDWPTSVAVDQVERATDDEVTYVVRNVQLSEG